jgi:hypothetical protein
MARFRIITSTIVDTGDADVFGLEHLEPRVIAKAVGNLLRVQALAATDVGQTIVAIGDGGNTAAEVAGAIDRAETTA